MNNNGIIRNFIQSETAAGIILFLAVSISILLSNFGPTLNYVQFWHTQFYGVPLSSIINDGLMTLFFLLIGLEIEREMYDGELSSVKQALLPIVGALGGVFVPAFIYFLINIPSRSWEGIGIPMATDIAFLLSFFLLLKKQIPHSLKILFIALAIVDDICAILVLALFYSKEIYWNYLLYAFCVVALLFILNRVRVVNLFPYLLGGILLWFFILKSGIHSTIAGVILAFLIPYHSNKKLCPSSRLQSKLHYPVALIILPLFALTNTAIQINPQLISTLLTLNSLGIFFGLVIGKPLGISIVIYFCLKFKLIQLPHQISISHIVGGSILAGIGFTMSIFISTLSFDNQHLVESSKFTVILSSLVAGVFGLLFFRIKTCFADK